MRHRSSSYLLCIITTGTSNIRAISIDIPYEFKVNWHGTLIKKKQRLIDLPAMQRKTRLNLHACIKIDQRKDFHNKEALVPVSVRERMLYLGEIYFESNVIYKH